MRNRSKLILTTAALAVSCALLSGCGGSSSTASSAASSAASPAASAPASSAAADSAENGSSDALADAVNTLLDANPISNPFEIAAMNIEYDFNLPEPAAGKAADIVSALTTYREDQVAFYGNYAEFAQAQENVKNAVIASTDDRVVMVIASNECTADLTSAVNSVLGK